MLPLIRCLLAFVLLNLAATTEDCGKTVCKDVERCQWGDEPKCIVACELAQDCTNAVSVKWSATNKRCVCSCRNQWSGDRCEKCEGFGGDCDECLSGHINFPACTACDLKAHCSGHASAVKANTQKTKCECTCDNRWTGDDCATCPRQYDAAKDCSVCSEGYVGAGCEQCTSDKHCNGHAKAVSSDPSRTTCLCTCNDGYEGQGCDRCAAGYVGYPSCKQCTVKDDCRGRALKAEPNPSQTACVCTCNNKWEGADCGTCPEIYDKDTCSTCAKGRVGFPTCKACTIADDCSNRAQSVTSDGKKCMCSCNSGFEGDTCERCAAGYIEPGCQQCTSKDHCTSHAASVTDDGQRKACICKCAGQWQGDRCDSCPAKYDQTSCSRCADGIDYPTCTTCTISSHCSGRATSVAPDAKQTKCVCQCVNQWGGSSCDTCPSQYSGANCDECAEGHVMLPTCRKCTVGTDCSGHATSVTDEGRVKCVCTCANKWEGSTCDVCPAIYGGKDCNVCAVGRVGYPTCRECSIDTDCNGRAAGVTSNRDFTKCVCSCKVGYEGDTCDRCAGGYTGVPPACEECTASYCNDHSERVDSTPDRTQCLCKCKPQYDGEKCERCKTGYIGYPSCRQCTTDGDCTGHASTVTSDGTTCKCTCKGQWKGDKCDTCAPEYDQAQCDRCADGRAGYPTCYLCDVDTHCSSHAESVTSANDVCKCLCKAQYDGTDCSRCRVAHINYPTCTVCTNEKHCNGNARSASSNRDRSSCVCYCKSGYEGASCEKCREGYVGWPSCRACTVAGDCSSQAKAVTDDGTRTTCKCTCSNQWSGDSCSVCPVQYGGKNCNECASPQSIYPSCAACDVDVHCSGHATSVAPDSSGKLCVCQCSAGWEGSTCDTCPSKYENNGKCDTCAAGRIGFPDCTACSVGVHCSGNADTVSDDGTRTTCVCSGVCPSPPCTCNYQWTGPTCSTCPAKYGGSQCNECARNHIKYPECTKCTVDDNCGGVRGKSVTTDMAQLRCVCTCAPGFAGPTCSECAEGYVYFPTCEKCEAEKCSGHAEVIGSTPDRTECTCKCKGQWTGLTCSVCPPQYDKDKDCMTCAAGHADYPTCFECSITQHCNGNAVTVSPDPTGRFCQCKCKEKYEGAMCNRCKAEYFNYPACETCSPAKHCNGFAMGSQPNPSQTGCVCHCFPGYDGPSCATCSPGYMRAGHECRSCSPSVHCNDHAESAVPNANGNGCECKCSGHWVGTTCDTCPPPYNGTFCDECAAGHVNYPQCTPCSVDTHCTGRATSVTDDGGRKACVCTCRNQWSGLDCSTCPILYGGGDCDECGVNYTRVGSYPMCGMQCSVGVNCHDHAVNASWNHQTKRCDCTCRNKWSGETCDTCPAMFGGRDCDECASGSIQWPDCIPCSSAVHCHGNACPETSCAAPDPDGKVCQCKCAGKWTGDTCDVCPASFGGPRCDRCAENHIVFPLCIPCTNKGFCNNRAERITTDANQTVCVCHCANGWEGEYCSLCPPTALCARNTCTSPFGCPSFPTPTPTPTLTLPATSCDSFHTGEECHRGGCWWVANETLSLAACVAGCSPLPELLCLATKGCRWMGVCVGLTPTPTLTLTLTLDDRLNAAAPDDWLEKWSWLLILLGVLCMLCIVVAAYAKRKRRKKEVAFGGDEQPDEELLGIMDKMEANTLPMVLSLDPEPEVPPKSSPKVSLSPTPFEAPSVTGSSLTPTSLLQTTTVDLPKKRMAL